MFYRILLLSPSFKSKWLWNITTGGSLPAISVDDRRGREVFVWRWVVNVRARFDLTSPSANLHSTDFTGGFTLLVPNGVLTKGSWELFVQHTSSHIGDEIIADGFSKNSYSREVMELSYAWIYPYLESVFSIHAILHKFPASKELIAFQYHLKVPIKKRWFMAADTKLRNIDKWGIDFKLQAGAIVGKIQKGRPNMNLVLEYFNGYSFYGQFFRSREQSIGFGLLSRVH